MDVYVPGCPPRPEALLEGMFMLQDKIEKKTWRKINPIEGFDEGNVHGLKKCIMTNQEIQQHRFNNGVIIWSFTEEASEVFQFYCS